MYLTEEELGDRVQELSVETAALDAATEMRAELTQVQNELSAALRAETDPAKKAELATKIHTFFKGQTAAMKEFAASLTTPQER